MGSLINDEEPVGVRSDDQTQDEHDQTARGQGDDARARCRREAREILARQMSRQVLGNPGTEPEIEEAVIARQPKYERPNAIPGFTQRLENEGSKKKRDRRLNG